MSNRRTKTSGVSSCKCSVCGEGHPSTVKGTKHRRCGGFMLAPRRPKYAATPGVRGTWQ
jgi:hypothetical protein